MASRLRLPPGMESGLEAQYRYNPPPMTFTSAAHACIVEVDADTGFVKIKRWVSCEDCGKMINPAIVEGQIAGGLAQAIGAVLLEEAALRRARQSARGRRTRTTCCRRSPTCRTSNTSTPARPSKSEGGFRGVGEGGAIIGPPTLVNAIADALAPFGEVPVDLPLTPAKLLRRDRGAIAGRPNHSNRRRVCPANAGE